jgi:glycosyltransferase involved in cell wall biosynthesis
MSRPRVLLLQPSLLPAGGANSVAVWMIEALKGDHDITLLSWDAVDFDRINGYYGTRLRPGDFEIRYVPRWPERVRRIARIRGELLQRYLMLRWGRRLAPDFDVTLSVNGEIDVGLPAIQYVHYPRAYVRRPDTHVRWFHRLPGALRMYYAMAQRIAPVSAARIRGNLTLVNSDWTGRSFREQYGGETVTLYPPVFGTSTPRPWALRDDAFVCVGRIVPDKNIATIVAILERVRAAGRNVTLRLIGTSTPRDRYVRHVRSMTRTRPWVELHENISRDALMALVGRSRYGIHAMEDEHFGIAVAEMARSGCIPFAPDSGGQVEVLGDERLLFRSADDAVSKILRVTGDPVLQRELAAVLAAGADRFDYAVFRERVRALIAAWLARRPSATASQPLLTRRDGCAGR